MISGGPSSASSFVCSSPMQERSHTITLLKNKNKIIMKYPSSDPDAKTVSSDGSQAMQRTESLWPSKTLRESEVLRLSQSEIVYKVIKGLHYTVSSEPVRNKLGFLGWCLRQETGLLCALKAEDSLVRLSWLKKN